MPSRQRNHNVAGGDRNYRAELDLVLGLAHRRLSRRRTRRWISATLAIPLLLCAAWLGLLKFTLLDLPWWPVLFVPLLWFPILALWVARTRPVSRSSCARYLDSVLELDERVLTCLELGVRARLGSLSGLAASFAETLYADTVEIVQQRLYLLPSAPGATYRGWRGIAPRLAALAAVILLVGVIVVPSPVAGQKSEQNAVRAALDAQVQKLAGVRAELVKRADVPDNLKATISAQLQQLEAQLRASTQDRSQALAAIATAEDKLRELLPAASADFDPLVRASQQLQSAAAGTTEWDPAAATDKTDLGLGADAASYVTAYVNQFTNVQARVMASALERAASLAANKDPELAQNLLDAAAAVRLKDSAKATAALSAASSRLSAASKELQTAQALEGTLSNLDDGRQTIAQAGASATKRGQVGFRRPASSADPGAQAADQNGSTGQQDPTPANGPNIGQNQPAFGASNGPGPGTLQQSPGSGSGTSGAGAGGTQSSNPLGVGKSGSSSGAGGGSPSGQGPVQGAINGPIRVGGASGGGSDAQGNGVGTSTSTQAQTGSAPSYQIYVPTKPGTAGKSGTSGQFAPPNPTGDGLGGRVGNGSTGAAAGGAPGLGQLTQVRTPYNEVLGQYAEQATQALARAYVPPDAKEYVKQYFTELGKQNK
jgi:hypothetical protein